MVSLAPLDKTGVALDTAGTAAEMGGARRLVDHL